MNAVWAWRVWERKDFLGSVLWILALPVSLFFGLATQIRNLLYSLEWLTIKNLPCAVVSVGNLTVGGTGKTPTTLWLGQELGRRGYRVAILSRGYKRRRREPELLEPCRDWSLSLEEGENPAEAGDEPMMMAKIFGQRVGVGEDRYGVGVRVLQKTKVDVFLLDDGFQYRQLRRDLDLLLLGSDWRGWLLPAGSFREPRSALRRASLYLLTGAQQEWQPFLEGYPKEAIFAGALRPKGLLTLERQQWKEVPLSLLDRSKILAVSAIANPTAFYRMIHEWEGDIADTLEFPDHHNYSARDWQRITRAARNVDLIVTTEKDILKLARFPFAKEKLFALRVEMVVENGASLIQAVEAAILAKRKQG